MLLYILKLPMPSWKGGNIVRIGVPKERKNHEHRVGLTPENVRELVHHGHSVAVESSAGSGIGFLDEHYREAGAQVCDVDEAWNSQLVVKVKEPLPEEFHRLREDLTLFTFLHLAADPPQARALMDSGATAIAYETVTSERGSHPLLRPMSAVAGRLSIQVGARALECISGGRGVLLGGVPGVQPANVVVLGGGMAGTHATQMAVGLDADVTIVEKFAPRRMELKRLFGDRVSVIASDVGLMQEAILEADLVIGSVLVPGAAAPKLVTAEMVRQMLAGSAMVDIAIDQGGCFETSRPTTHDDPTYVLDGVVHYCVTNMPGAVARTSTQALTAVTLPYVMQIADRGWRAVMKADSHFRTGLSVYRGRICNRPAAESLGFMEDFREPVDLVGSVAA